MSKPVTFEPSPFSGPGRWFKGGFHCHTLHSDGGLSVQETVQIYRDLGYHCLGITDHRTVTPAASLSEPGFLIIDSTENGGDPDIIGVGVAQAAPEDDSLDSRCAALASQGGFVIAAHPHYCAADPAQYAACPDLHALEILNAYCDQAYANGRATEVWDLVLGRGKRIWGVAGDDAHLNPKKRYYSRAGQAWVQIWAPELSRQGVLDALRRGAFYSTEGPLLERIHVQGTEAHIACTPVAQVRWRTYGRVGFVDHAPPGGALTASTLPDWFQPRMFLRVELVDHAGKRAWSNPFFVDGTTAGRDA